MKIVLVDAVPNEVLTFALAGNVVYRPDLLFKSTSIVVAALEEIAADAVIASAMPLDAALRIFAQTKDVAQVRVTVGPAPIAIGSFESTNRLTIIDVSGEDAPSAYASALDALERRETDRLPTVRPSNHLGRSRRVTLVGAGIVNLVTGYHLQEAGYEIHVLDAGPEPQTDSPWTAYGCSRGGDAARMFTLSEMDNYNDKIVSPQMNSVFNERVCDLGWDLRASTHASFAEKAWLTEYEMLPVWLAKRYNADIFAFNRESQASWDGWIEREPDLFKACEIREGILRLYADPFHFGIACERQAWIGATRRVLSPDEVAAFQPALGDAVASGQIAGGILVAGFTVNVHKFIHRLVETMRQRGARFDWNERATRIRFGDRGVVLGLASATGPIVSDAYVISPGAYAQTLLSGTRSADKIHGILGAWLRLPNLEPSLDMSLKLARRGHITEDANITVATDRSGEPLMILGSGYGYTGSDPRNIDEALLRQVHEGLIDTAERFFPRAYAAARASGMVESSLKHCVRPWTSTSLGLFEMLPMTEGGCCVITGGHNTGGFAQAPAIAAAVRAALEGRDHPMHRLYHPDRAALFMDRLVPERPTGVDQAGCEYELPAFDRSDHRVARLNA